MHSAPAIRASSCRWRLIAAVAVIALACGAAYHNTFSVPELLDDISAISGNPSIQRPWSWRDALTPPPTSGLGGRPFANLSFALNYWSSWNDLRSYHAVNLLIHLGAALALFGIVRRTFLRRSPERVFPAQQAHVLTPTSGAASITLALAIALLWAVHPVLTSSVTYLSQRTESLMGVCYLFTLYAFVRGAEGEAGSRGWLAVSVFACLAGMAAKEVMVTAPLLVLLYDRTFVSGSFVAALQRRWRYYTCLAATWLLLAFVLTDDLHQRNVGFGLGVTWWSYALTECRALFVYLGLGMWPHPLIFDRGAMFLSVGAALPFLVAAALLVFATVLALRFRPKIAFLPAWFFLVLAPTSSVVPVALQPVAENRLYLPLAALIAGLVIAAQATLGRRGYVPVILVAASWLFLSERRNAEFQNPVQLWADTVAKSPNNARARDNYGQMLQRARRYDEALAQFQKALELNPRSHSTYGLVASLFVEVGRLEDAVIAYRRGIELKPDFALFHSNLGTCLNRLGRVDEAIAECREGIRLDPNFAPAHANLGHALYRGQQVEEAARAFRSASELAPLDSDAHYNRGLMLLLLGRHAEAAEPLGTAVRLRPGDANARNTYAVALMELQRLDEAKQQLEEALRIDPNNAQAHTNMDMIGAAAKKSAQQSVK